MVNKRRSNATHLSGDMSFNHMQVKNGSNKYYPGDRSNSLNVDYRTNPLASPTNSQLVGKNDNFASTLARNRNSIGGSVGLSPTQMSPPPSSQFKTP